jgi:conjugal transfer ATP-binding protein TraC
MFESLSRLGQKLAGFVGDRTQFGVKTDSDAIPALEQCFDYESLNRLLHYDGYSPDTNIFHNKKSQGFILEAYPLLGANEETVNILTSLVTDVLPANTDLQFILWGSPKIGEILDRFEQARSGNGEIFEWLAKKRTDFLKKGAFKSLTTQGTFILRDMRLFISVSQPRTGTQDCSDKLMALRDDIASSLKSIQMPTMNVAVNEFISVMTDMLHPSSDVYPTRQEWNPYDSLSQQISHPEYFIRVYKDKLQFENREDKWEARALSVKEYPKSMAQYDMTNAIGKLFNDSLQIPCPYIKTLSLRLFENDALGLGAEFKTDRKKKAANRQDAQLKPNITKEYQDWAFVNERLAEGDRLVKTHFQVLFFAKEQEANHAERKIRDLYRANGWRLKKTLYLQLQSYLAMLPMMMSEGLYSDMRLLGRLHTMTAFNAMNIAPLQGEWKGTQSVSMILPGRRGQMTSFNPFDNREGNYNLGITAASGKGKSVFIQDYIVSMLGSGGRVWVIDVGRSYEKTCKLLNGTFIEFTRENSICLNPFTFIRDFNSSLTMLKPLLAAMAHPVSNASDEEIAFLEKAAKAAWEEKGNAATITTVSTWLSKQDSPICQNLSHLLYSYTKDGMNAGYFEGDCNIDLSDSFVVLELQELKARKDLQQIVLLLLMYQISEAMYLSKRDQPKSCIIDEAPDLFSGDNKGAEKFVGTGYRQARKYGGNFLTSMQGINDYFKNETTIAIYENSDIKIILGQNPETIDQIKKSERLSMDGFTERLYKSLRKTDDFSECVIKMPSGLSVHRIVLDPYSRILYSSKAEEFDAVNQLQAQGKSLKEAIEIVARKFHHEN